MLMVPLPWHLVSPVGVIHVVRDEAQLKLRAESEPDVVVHRKNVLLQLVDPANSKSLDQLPMHWKHWQLRRWSGSNEWSRWPTGESRDSNLHHPTHAHATLPNLAHV